MNSYAQVFLDLIPTDKSRSYKLLDTSHDNIFRSIVRAGWCNESDGDVEATSGYFSIIEIPTHPGERLEMQNAVDSAYEPDTIWPDTGWYVTTENSDGIIYVYEFLFESMARAAYERLSVDYLNWIEAVWNQI